MMGTGLLGLAGWGFLKKTIIDKLEFFEYDEFGWQGLFLDTKLLLTLDAFRKKLNSKVLVSPAPGSMIRFTSSDSESQHFWYKGAAIDVMIPEAPLNYAYELATEFFSGVGAYPDWKPYKGLHLDTRKTENGKVATWGGINQNGKQVYVMAIDALQRA